MQTSARDFDPEIHYDTGSIKSHQISDELLGDKKEPRMRRIYHIEVWFEPILSREEKFLADTFVVAPNITSAVEKLKGALGGIMEKSKGRMIFRPGGKYDGFFL